MTILKRDINKNGHHLIGALIEGNDEDTYEKAEANGWVDGENNIITLKAFEEIEYDDALKLLRLGISSPDDCFNNIKDVEPVAVTYSGYGSNGAYNDEDGTRDIGYDGDLGLLIDNENNGTSHSINLGVNEDKNFNILKALFDDTTFWNNGEKTKINADLKFFPIGDGAKEYPQIYDNGGPNDNENINCYFDRMDVNPNYGLWTYSTVKFRSLYKLLPLDDIKNYNGGSRFEGSAQNLFNQLDYINLIKDGSQNPNEYNVTIEKTFDGHKDTFKIYTYEIYYSCGYNGEDDYLLKQYVLEINSITCEKDYVFQGITFPLYYGYTILYKQKSDEECVYSGYYEPDENGEYVIDGIKFNNSPTEEKIYSGDSLPDKTGTVMDGIKFKVSENRKCSGNKKITEACSNCKNHIYKLKTAMKEFSGNLSTYIPYIARVTNHWYRDVYFVDPNLIDGTTGQSVNVVQSDHEYEEATGERWTRYYTYEEYKENVDPSIEIPNEDLYGEYALFKYDSSKAGGFGEIYYGTQDQADEEGIKVIKKPITQNISEDKNNDGVIDETEYWNAYALQENQVVSDWEQAFTSDDDADQDSGNLGIESKYLKNIYIKSTKSSAIVQTEDGKRGETNPEIKKMFLENYYFQYDGTPETANKIYAIKANLYDTVHDHDSTLWVETKFNGTKLKEESSVDANGEVSSAFGKNATNGLVDENGNPLKYVYFTEFGDGTQAGSIYANFFDEPQEGAEPISNYIKRVSLTKDSLGAFSMLENTHTLDADYIYKDFKELIVELGYFTKEELTESKEIFQWVIPEVFSYGWPTRVADKKENEYGTFIHSVSDYQKIENESLKSQLQDSQTTNNSGATEEPVEKSTYPFEGFSGNESVVSPATGILQSYGTYKRNNVDTGKEEEVGYAVIKVLDKENYNLLQNSQGIDKFSKDELKQVNDGNGKYKFNMDDDKRSVYGYDLFYEDYSYTGVAGDLILIDGFDCINGITSVEDFGNSGNLNNLYKPDEVYQTESNSTRKKLEAKAEAKKSAKSIYKVGDTVFIKEGTELGTTKEDPYVGTEQKIEDINDSQYKYTPYIRIIMKTTEDEIVEDVESYIKLDDGNTKLDFEKFLYWMGVYAEGGGDEHLTQEGGIWYSDPSKVEDLGDGNGRTQYFGLSFHVLDTAHKLGYTYNIDQWKTQKIKLEEIVDIYLALIEEDKAFIKSELGNDISDGYLQAFISVKHNYGNLTSRGEEYKTRGSVSESTWCTYEGSEYAEALTNRRIGEWKVIKEGKYYDFYGGNHNEIDFTAGGKYSEDTPFTDWCKEHGVAIKEHSS